MSQPSYSATLHRTAVLTAAGTLLLIFMGGLVTSHHAGMSVPDWPNSYGYNMFTFPPSLWLSRRAGGIFYEHSHRLMGTLVGMLSIVLTILAWKFEPRRWVRWLCTGVLGAVIFQGVLGGLRVVLVKLDLAIVHACVAQAFFCLATFAALVTSRWWIEAPDRSHWLDRGTGHRVVALGVACVVAVYLQLIVGATMRHYDAGLAIPDLPLAYGKVLPPVNATELDAVNRARVWDMQLPPVTLSQVWLHFGHRVGAVLVTCLLVSLVVATRRARRDRDGLLWPAFVLVGLLIAQLTLGVLTVLMKKPADIASFHVAVGAMVLVTTLTLTVRAARLYARAWRGAADPSRARHAGLGFTADEVDEPVAVPQIA